MVEEKERIGSSIANVLVEKIFAAGLDLHSALAQTTDEAVRGRLTSAVDTLDESIQTIRRAVTTHLDFS